MTNHFPIFAIPLLPYSTERMSTKKNNFFCIAIFYGLLIGFERMNTKKISIENGNKIENNN